MLPLPFFPLSGTSILSAASLPLLRYLFSVDFAMEIFSTEEWPNLACYASFPLRFVPGNIVRKH